MVRGFGTPHLLYISVLVGCQLTGEVMVGVWSSELVNNFPVCLESRERT